MRDSTGARPNRSMPAATVIPVLAYPDVAEAGGWLSRAFGFRPRLRIGDHRLQMTVGDGALVPTAGAAAPGVALMIRVADADAHCALARAAGGAILTEPTSYPYGERQYTARDPHGYLWTFSATERDVDPAQWGGELTT